MISVNRAIFETRVEQNEHAPGIKVNSRISGDDFVTEYKTSYDGVLLAQVVSSKTSETYFMKA